MTTLEIQRRLAALGYQPGPIDGVRGRLTMRAVRAFQADRGLAVDGIVGPETGEALFGRFPLPALGRGGPLPAFGKSRTPPSPEAGEGEGAPWYDEALRLQGTREAAGAADNPLILRWARRLKLAYAHDSTAWCGLFVAHCIGFSLPDEPLPANPLGARNWLGFGVEVKPTLGAVLVFWRGSRSGWLGHVGFYAGEDARASHVLGGNQSDAVGIVRIERARLLGARWPRTAPAPSGGAVVRARGRTLSLNEA